MDPRKTVSECCRAGVTGLFPRCEACSERCELTWPLCAEGICDGSGVVTRDDGTDGARDEKCPCAMDEGDNDDR